MVRPAGLRRARIDRRRPARADARLETGRAGGPRRRRRRAVARAPARHRRFAPARIGRALGSRAGERGARHGGAVVGGGQRRAGAGAPAVAGDDVCAGAPGGAPRAPFAAAAKVRRASSAASHSRLPAAPAHRLRQRPRRVLHVRPRGVPHDLRPVVGGMGDRRRALRRRASGRDRGGDRGGAAAAPRASDRRPAMARARRSGLAVHRITGVVAATDHRPRRRPSLGSKQRSARAQGARETAVRSTGIMSKLHAAALADTCAIAGVAALIWPSNDPKVATPHLQRHVRRCSRCPLEMAAW